MKKSFIVLTILIVVMLASTMSVAQMFPKPKGMPADSKIFGKTYGEWSAAWWQWALAMPASEHPLFDTADCSAGQSGNMWFLGGKFCQNTSQVGCNSPTFTAERACTIPSGKALFFPILNGDDSFVEEPPGVTEQVLRTNIKGWSDPGSNFLIQASIDGWPLQPVRICPTGTYCTPKQSPLFTFTLADHDNLFAAVGESWVQDGATSQAVSDGYYVLLPPLPVGKHEITFYAMNGGYSVDVTYHVTIVQGKP